MISKLARRSTKIVRAALAGKRGKFSELEMHTRLQRVVEPNAEDLADAVGREPPQADLAAALEDLVDGEVAFEDEVPAVFDLRDGIEPRQVHFPPFLF